MTGAYIINSLNLSRNRGGVEISSKYFMVHVGVGSAVGTVEVSIYLSILFYGV